MTRPEAARRATSGPSGPTEPTGLSRRPTPTISVPTGGGAVRSIDEKFAANPATGTATLTIPLPISPGRSGFEPELSLAYDSGTGNGAWGLGWSVALPAITRRTDQGVPRYDDAHESDVFLLAGAEDLVPVLRPDGNRDRRYRTVGPATYTVDRYRPRTEGLYARIERWSDPLSGDVRWRTISPDNVTTWFGRDASSRVADGQLIYGWLACESYDDRGNALVFTYKPEDDTNVDLASAHERGRPAAARGTGRYLKSIRYGNRTSRLVHPDLSTMDWMFELVLDYGEHDEDRPTPSDPGDWPCRPDPFSSYRSGFEVRTYRLCRRILMFHHFPDEPGVGADCLVRSVDLTYREGPAVSLLTAATQRGYRRSGDEYVVSALPPLELDYSEPAPADAVRVVDPASLEGLPIGLNGAAYSLLDLDGEGIPGILADTGQAWLYKPALGEGRFGPLRMVATMPATAAAGSRHQFVDLAGDGRLDAVEFDGPTPGFVERTDDGGWGHVLPFRALPAIAWDDPNLRFVDLNGDGLADVLLTEEDALVWYPSLGESGFDAAVRVALPRDEASGPRLVFADGTESVHLADMSGDGLTDLVRIRNGEVCYWPSLGHGRFGPRVVMDDAPRFDHPDRFDQRRIRIVDVDGSGPSDLVYLGSDGTTVHVNRSGNGWGPPRRLAHAPVMDDVADVTTADLLGNGTACLVWSSALPGEATPMRYVDLVGGVKPYLLTSIVNNVGARTLVRYASSTSFYLADRAAGRPWATRLPFPVHVIDRVEVIDHIGRDRYVTRYAYHHGRYDGHEREFCGFGLVEHWDTEEFDLAGDTPPVLTRTWYHTGAYQPGGGVADHFAPEYYREPGLTDSRLRAQLLPDTVLPPGLTLAEEREACRSLRGSLLRQETYGLDGSSSQDHPYAVTESSYTVVPVQRRRDNRHAVFAVHHAETVSYHYEREPTAPRVTHELTLRLDRYGAVLASASVAYGRSTIDTELSAADRARQAATLVTYTEHEVTNDIGGEPGPAVPDAYRASLPFQTRVYEVTGLLPAPGRPRLTPAELLAVEALVALPYEQVPTPGRVQRRLIDHTRTQYRRDTLDGPLPLGQVGSLAVPLATYHLALTPGLVAGVYGPRVTAAMLAEGGYVHSDGDAAWWEPSGTVRYSPRAEASPAEELAFARTHFFLSHLFTDPFGNVTTVHFDRYDLMVLDIVDALGNRVTAGVRDGGGAIVANGNDYRVLEPRMVMDVNRNLVAVAFDALGEVVGTAVMGKPAPAVAEGDSLDDFEPDLSDAQIAAYLRAPLAGDTLLGRATGRVVYDRFAYWRTRDRVDPSPPTVATLARDTHDAELAPGAAARIRHTLTYYDGLGREIQKKVQAEPGPLEPGGDDVTPRWVGTGWAILNNKGLPVRVFEPFFTAGHEFEDARIAGVSTVYCHDPVGRVVATVQPDHAFDKVVFDPWRHETWDANDTVGIDDPGADADVGGYLERLLPTDYRPTWYRQRIDGPARPPDQEAARQTEPHANTPSRVCLDALGRPFLTVTHNRFDDLSLSQPTTVDKYAYTRVELDIEGNPLAVIDAAGRTIARHEYDVAGDPVRSSHLDAGEEWVLIDVDGLPLYAWDGTGRRVHMRYDALRRPIEELISVDGRTERLSTRTRYGESVAGAEADNRRGRAVEVCDDAGRLTSDAYDFKGNLLSTTRTLAAGYAEDLDWSGPVPLESTGYTSRTWYDAHDRPIRVSTPDSSLLAYTYNEAGYLETVSVRLPGASAFTTYVADVDYDANGQRTLVEYGNGARAAHEYDPLTLRLTRLRTVAAGQVLQDLRYTYDAVGNLTHIEDEAQQTVYFNNHRVTASAHYVYDAQYRLVSATGREQLGQVIGGQVRPGGPGPHPGDGTAMGRYTQRYAYDVVGNIDRIVHIGSDARAPGWTRRYTYDGNRLATTSLGTNAGPIPTEVYGHDALGRIVAMPHLPMLRWSDHGNLRASSRQVVTGGGRPETTYYVYDPQGERLRKVTDGPLSAAEVAAGVPAARRSERVYLGAFDLYREYDASTQAVRLERTTLHVNDDDLLVALVETTTRDNGTTVDAPVPAVRYQFGNHLGSAVLELDEHAAVLSYEEYHPYGTTSYSAGRGIAQVSLKRFRYTGKERDEETGFYYHGARYYAPWLGRWTAPDPAGDVDGPNRYVYARCAPTTGTDPTGLATKNKKRQPGATFGEKNEKFTGRLLEANNIKYKTQVRTKSGKAIFDKIKKSSKAGPYLTKGGSALEDKARNVKNKVKADGSWNRAKIRRDELPSHVQEGKHMLERKKPRTRLNVLYGTNKNVDEGLQQAKEYRDILTKDRAELADKLESKAKLSKTERKLVKQSGYSRQELGAALKRTDAAIGVTTYDRAKQAIDRLEGLKKDLGTDDVKGLRTEAKATTTEAKVAATEAKVAATDAKAVSNGAKAAKAEVTEAKVASKAAGLAAHAPNPGDASLGPGEEQQAVTQEQIATIPETTIWGRIMSATFGEADNGLRGGSATAQQAQQPAQKPAPTIYPGKKLTLKQFDAQGR